MFSQMTTGMFHLCKHFPVLSSSKIYHRVCNKSNTTGATSGAKLPVLPDNLSSPSGFSEVRVTVLQCIVMLSRSLFVLLSFLFWVIVLPVLLRFTDYDYPFVIFNSSYVALWWILILINYVIKYSNTVHITLNLDN